MLVFHAPLAVQRLDSTHLDVSLPRHPSSYPKQERAIGSLLFSKWVFSKNVFSKKVLSKEDLIKVRLFIPDGVLTCVPALGQIGFEGCKGGDGRQLSMQLLDIPL